MSRWSREYVHIGIFLVVITSGSIFAQNSASQGAPTTRFGLPVANPTTTTVATPSVPASTVATATSTQAVSSITSATAIAGTSAGLNLSSAHLVLTQKGVTSSVNIPWSKFVFNAANTVLPGSPSSAAGKPTLWVTFTKPWDEAPDPFLTAQKAGGSFDAVSLAFSDASGKPLYTVTLKTVTIKSINKGVDASLGSASEEVSLSFAAFQMVDVAGVSGATSKTGTDSWTSHSN